MDMKIIAILLVLVMLFSSGCVSAGYNTETKEITYVRVGDQEFGGFEAVLPDGSYITFEHQKSEAQILKDTVRMIFDFFKLGMIANGVPTP